MFAGLNKPRDYESKLIERLGIRCAGPTELASDSDPVLKWIADNKIKHLAIHLDFDVLDPKLFCSLGFAHPERKNPGNGGAMTFPQVARLITDVSNKTSVVGLGITEHKPWDATNLKTDLPILSQK